MRYDHISSTKSSVTQNSKNSAKFVVSSRTAHRFKHEGLDEKLKHAISDEKKKFSNRSSAVTVRRKEHKTPNKLSKVNKIPFRLMKIQQTTDRSESRSQEYDRPIISHNIFMKNDNYYYSDEVKLTKIFQKFYYENFKLEDLKEYILPAFRKVNGAQNYFEILFAEAKNFGYAVRDSLIEKIRKLVQSKLDNNVDANDSSSNLSFKRFGPNCNSYTKAITTLHEHYKLVENVNFEIEKQTRQYQENFLEKRKNKISFDSFLFHKRMFINCVYNEPVIHSFVVSVVSFFKQNNFYAQNFQASYQQIMEIFENLEQLSQTLVQKYVNNNTSQQHGGNEETYINGSNNNSHHQENGKHEDPILEKQQNLNNNHTNRNHNKNQQKEPIFKKQGNYTVSTNNPASMEEDPNKEPKQRACLNGLQAEEEKEKTKKKRNKKKKKKKPKDKVDGDKAINNAVYLEESSFEDLTQLKKMFNGKEMESKLVVFSLNEEEKGLFGRPVLEDC